MWSFQRGIFLNNSNAGSEKIDKKLKQALPILSMSIKSLHIIHTETLSEMKNILKEKAKDVDIVIILGGDGTVHEVINVIGGLEKRPVIGILPGGTSNDFSRTLGIPQNITEAARVIAKGKVREIDLAKSNSRFFLNFWGIGLITDTSVRVDEEEKENFGVLSYYMSTFRSIRQAEQFSYQIIADDEEKLEGEAVLIIAFNGRFLGTREVEIAYLEPDDGKLDVFIVKESNITSFKEVLSAVNPYAQPPSFEEVIHFQTNKLQVYTKERNAIDMDGEIVEETPSTIVVLPKHLRMITL